MTERTVTIGFVSYLDPDGVPRVAQAGETVRVHPDQLERFDAVNGTPEPKKRTPRKKG